MYYYKYFWLEYFVRFDKKKKKKSKTFIVWG